MALCELVQEVIDGGYYAKFGFTDAETYLEERLGLSYRSIRRRLAVLEAVRRLPAKDQADAKAQLAAVGAHKAAIVAPALQQDAAGWRDWVKTATTETVEALQARVSRVLGHRPRGSGTDAGERWYGTLLAGLPEDLQADTKRAFHLAAQALEKTAPKPTECWAAIVHEFISTWEPTA